VSSKSQNRVYRVTADGRLIWLAGNGTSGYSGDGGPATSAQLYGPTGVAVDSTGNLFIADYENNRIRKVFKPSVSTNLNLRASGSAASSTVGLNGAAQAGYATVAINSGAAPYGTAVFSFKQNGVTVTEAGVPACRNGQMAPKHCPRLLSVLCGTKQ
jgi:hypothetical protein